MARGTGRDEPPVVGNVEGPSAWMHGFGRSAKWLGVAVAVGFALHIVVPVVGDAGEIFDTIRTASPGWLLIASLASALTYLFAAYGVRAALGAPMPLGTVGEAQLAASAAILFAPAGLGGLALNERFFERGGLARSEVVAGLTVNTLVALLVHVSGMVVLSLAFGFRLPTPADTSVRYVFDGAVVVAVVSGFVLWALPQSRRVLRPIVAALRALPTIARNWRRLFGVAAAALAVNVAYAASLQASLAAFGAAPGFGHTMLVYLVAATIGTVTPTPGGLGGTEFALVAGLSRVGASQPQAVAAALAFRLVTFWIPVIPGLVALRRLRARGLL